MEDMLSFVSRRIKNTDSLSMQQLIAEMGLSKSKFYRFMQEPWRFSEQDIENLVRFLNLNDEEMRILEKYRSDDTAIVESVPGQVSESEYGLNEIDSAIYDMIFENFPIQKDYQSKVYTLFNSGDKVHFSESSGVIKCSANDIAERINRQMSRNANIDNKSSIKICVFNTYDKEKIQLIYNLIGRINSIKDLAQNCGLFVKQVICSAEMTVADKFRAFSSLRSLYDFDNYNIVFTETDKGNFSNLDCFVIEYCDSNNRTQYLFGIIPSNDGAVVYEFEDKNLFDFLIYGSSDLFYVESENTVDLNDPIGYNKYMIESTTKYKKAGINCSLCFDNLVPDIWVELRSQIIQNSISSRTVRTLSDPNNVFKAFTDAQFIDSLFDSCINRWLITEEKEAINLIFASGLKEFSTTGYTIETQQFHIPLSDDLIIKELKYIKDRLGTSCKKKCQQYYIVDPSYCIPNFYCYAFKNYNLSSANNYYGRNVLVCTILYQKDMSTLFYDYIHDELIPDDRRKRYNSPLFTDERAAAFIDSLIDEVKERMAKNENQEN